MDKDGYKVTTESRMMVRIRIRMRMGARVKVDSHLPIHYIICLNSHLICKHRMIGLAKLESS
jgi:hypothetical protein